MTPLFKGDRAKGRGGGRHFLPEADAWGPQSHLGADFRANFGSKLSIRFQKPLIIGPRLVYVRVVDSTGDPKNRSGSNKITPQPCDRPSLWHFLQWVGNEQFVPHPSHRVSRERTVPPSVVRRKCL